MIFDDLSRLTAAVERAEREIGIALPYLREAAEAVSDGLAQKSDPVECEVQIDYQGDHHRIARGRYFPNQGRVVVTVPTPSPEYVARIGHDAVAKAQQQALMFAGYLP